MLTRLTSQRGGFSLVELLVTIFIAGMVFSAMVPLFINAQKSGAGDTQRVVCTAVARDRIEKVRQLDYKEITLANLNSATFKGGQFGTVYKNLTDPTSHRDIFVSYSVALEPAGALPGTEQFKVITVDVTWDDPATAAVEPPRPAYHTIMQTQIYKQFAGPIIREFTLIQNNIPVTTGKLTADPITLRARINSADIASMTGGIVEFSIFNSQSTLIKRSGPDAQKTPTVPNGDTYEWVWSPASAPDGQYNFAVVGYSGDHFQGNSWRITFMLEKGAPAAPTLTAEPGNTTVSLTWVTIPPATDLDHYEIWRSYPGQSDWVQIVPSTTTTTYLDSGLENGTSYWYKVAAYDNNGNAAFSDAVSATPVAPTADTTGPTAPGGLTATKVAGAETINLAWTASVDDPPPASPSGLDHYVIQRASDLAFTVGVVDLNIDYGYSQLSYPDAGTGYSTTWYYRVAGVDGLLYTGGTQGPWSNVASATTDPAPLRTLTVNRIGKVGVWVQSTLAPFKWYTTTGVWSLSRPLVDYSNANNKTTVWSNLPAGLYKVFYSPGSTTFTGASIDANLQGGDQVVTVQ